MSDKTFLVKASDMRELHYCVKGAKKFAEKHGLDWKKFVTEGIPAEELLATNDAMAIAFIKHVEVRDGRRR